MLTGRSWRIACVCAFLSSSLAEVSVLKTLLNPRLLPDGGATANHKIFEENGKYNNIDIK